jgi:hypothetical protein
MKLGFPELGKMIFTYLSEQSKQLIFINTEQVSLIFKFSCHVALKKVQGPHVT